MMEHHEAALSATTTQGTARIAGRMAQFLSAVSGLGQPSGERSAASDEIDSGEPSAASSQPSASWLLITGR